MIRQQVQGGLSERLRAGPLLSGLAFVLVVAVGFGARFLLENGLTWRCPSVLLLGLPCPSCGATRALAALSRTELSEALRLNPLVVISVAALLVAPLFRLKFGAFRRWLWQLLVALIALNWVYLLFFLPR